MNVLILNPGQDTGGQGIRIKEAFDRHSDWSVRSMHASRSFIKYPFDLQWDPILAQKLYDEADVVHHKNGLIYYPRLDSDGKPTVVHHQGTRLRNDPEAVYAEGESIGATQIVSTVDLLADAPGATWLPAPFDLEGIAQRYPRRKQRTLRIGHSPTNRAVKGTAEILTALNNLAVRHDIEVDLIEQVSWAVCLSRKALCDIFIDQVTTGYGNNAIEAMAMAIPVVSGWSEEKDRERFVSETGVTPQFVEATAQTIEARLEELIVSEELREEWGQRGRDFARMFHADHSVVARLKAIYAAAKPSSGTLRQYKPEALRRHMVAA